MTGYNLGMPGNTHVDRMIERGSIVIEEAQYLATMAVAFEQHTANLLAAVTATYADGSAMFPELMGADGELQATIKERLGLR